MNTHSFYVEKKDPNEFLLPIIYTKIKTIAIFKRLKILFFVNGTSPSPPAGTLRMEVRNVAKHKKDPSKGGVSAASIKGDAGPGTEPGGKRNSQNNQYKKQP